MNHTKGKAMNDEALIERENNARLVDAAAEKAQAAADTATSAAHEAIYTVVAAMFRGLASEIRQGKRALPVQIGVMNVSGPGAVGIILE